MKAQQIIDITTLEEHDDKCFSLVYSNEDDEIIVWVDEDGQIDYTVFMNDESVELSNETLIELESYLNNIGLEIQNNREKEALEDESNEVDCFEARKFKLTA